MKVRAAAVFIAAIALNAHGEGNKLGAAGLFKRASKSVVVVLAKTREGISQGSGVVVGPGRIVTNKHVVAGAMGLILIKQGDHIWRGEVARSGAGDLALIDVLVKVGERFDPPAITTRSAKKLEVGERAYAIGAPRGLEQSLSEGIVSGVSTDDGYSLVQTTAAISPGSSGGGLFDEKGALIGVTTLFLKDSQSLNFAIGSDEISALAATEAKLSEEGSPESDWDAPTEPTSKCATQTQPLPLGSIDCFVVSTYMDAIPIRLGLTNEIVQSWAEKQLRGSGIKIARSRSASCPELVVEVDSLIGENDPVVTYDVTVKVSQDATYVGGSERNVTTFERGKFGYAGTSVITGSLSRTLDQLLTDLLAERLRQH